MINQKQNFLDIVSLIDNVDEYLRIRSMRQLYKAVGDRAGPDISKKPHNDVELLVAIHSSRLAQF